MEIEFDNEPEDSIDITETDDESESDDEMVIDDILYEDSSDDDSDSDYDPEEENEIDQIMDVIIENKDEILKSESFTMSKKRRRCCYDCDCDP